MKQLIGTAVLAAVLLSPLAAKDGEKKPSANVGGVDEPGATITGIVKFQGPQPPRKPLKMAGNDFCEGACKGQTPLEEHWVFGKNGSDDTFANVLVYVAKGLQGKFDPPKEPKVLDQVGCIYTPHVVGVMVGQTLQIRNSDATLHNVMTNLRTNKDFNEAMSVKGGVLEKVFQNPVLMADFRCKMHPWMVAWVHVLDHPYYAVTGVDGTFTLKGLPPGDYDIAAKHESSRFAVSPARVPVSLKAGESKSIEFVYNAP
jgi:hypothetical protein